MEYKGGIGQTGKWYDPPLRFKDGAINVPKGPGMGVRIDKKVLSKAEKMV
jgi:L-alanine-DL-glutamate epimerase-like enolase superfamily enzyme